MLIVEMLLNALGPALIWYIYTVEGIYIGYTWLLFILIGIPNVILIDRFRSVHVTGYQSDGILSKTFTNIVVVLLRVYAVEMCFCILSFILCKSLIVGYAVGSIMLLWAYGNMNDDDPDTMDTMMFKRHKAIAQKIVCLLSRSCIHKFMVIDSDTLSNAVFDDAADRLASKYELTYDDARECLLSGSFYFCKKCGIITADTFSLPKKGE